MSAAELEPCGLEAEPYDLAPAPRDLAPEPHDLAALHAEAVAATQAAVRSADDARARELRDMGDRLRAEQEQLRRAVMGTLPAAVRRAAADGQRAAVVLRFGGADKLVEFCYLYMLRGPRDAADRAEMRAMGVRPLLPRLRAELQAAGFGVHHAWQRSTNDNTLAVTW